MKAFPLKIITAEGVIYDGQAEELILRASDGDIGFLANHANTVALLGVGRATVRLRGEKRFAACKGGFVSVANAAVTVLPMSFVWTENKKDR